MITKKEYETIYKHYIKNVMDYINLNKTNKLCKKKFYNISECYNYEENDKNIYEIFLYSVILLLNYEKNISNIQKYNEVYSWECIFRFLCFKKSISEIIEDKIKMMETLKIIEKTICNTIKEINIYDYKLYTNLPIIYITRNAFTPDQLLYTSSTGLIQCPKIPSLEIYIKNKNGNTLIGINNKSYKIMEWRNDISKLLIRPIVLSTHTIYTMYNISIFEKEYNLFKDIQSLLIVYYYLLKTDKDINIAKNIGLLQDKGISSDIILKFLNDFAKEYNYEIEKLHELRIKHEMIYPETFYGPYIYTKNEYNLIINELFKKVRKP